MDSEDLRRRSEAVQSIVVQAGDPHGTPMGQGSKAVADNIVPAQQPETSGSMLLGCLGAIVIVVLLGLLVWAAPAALGRYYYSHHTDDAPAYSEQERSRACTEAAARHQLESDPLVAADTSLGDLYDNAETADQLDHDYDC